MSVVREVLLSVLLSAPHCARPFASLSARVTAPSAIRMSAEAFEEVSLLAPGLPPFSPATIVISSSFVRSAGPPSSLVRRGFPRFRTPKRSAGMPDLSDIRILRADGARGPRIWRTRVLPPSDLTKTCMLTSGTETTSASPRSSDPLRASLLGSRSGHPESPGSFPSRPDKGSLVTPAGI